MATASASGSDASQSKVMSELALSRVGVNEEIMPETRELFGDKVDLSSDGITRATQTFQLFITG